ncbi:hypothetical protein SAY86_017970 [Trapa natans]|uniref:C2H2-type domain-containing protein n=1 Tax=Trapa natans TaxID=22666 RepID=A0AAN7R7Y0_TRANT|nr:hypothetical protein SAY86_017970 [Trapa natans]
MDAQSRNKALFRAKLSALKEKRIESPLVRYNESDQPVCRVCQVVLKHNANWDAHQASRKHHEAISALKAKASGLSSTTKNSDGSHSETPIIKTQPEKPLCQTSSQSSIEVPKRMAPSGLPPDFFDTEAKRPKLEQEVLTQSQSDDLVTVEDDPAHKTSMPNQPSLDHVSKILKTGESLEVKQAKGALPEGFFDNKDADLRARGIKPVKIDVKDEYKEFEKLIQEDLQEVDDRLEEEEIDAAEMIEEAESQEQKAYRERVEILRKKKLELKAFKQRKGSKEANEEATQEESSSDDDTVENFAVDWRAQHL